MEGEHGEQVGGELECDIISNCNPVTLNPNCELCIDLSTSM